MRPLLLTRALECAHTGPLFNQGHTPNRVRSGFDFAFVKICDILLVTTSLAASDTVELVSVEQKRPLSWNIYICITKEGLQVYNARHC